MTNNPATPISWGIQLSKLWIECGQGLPVSVREIALEVTKVRFPEDPISIVQAHGVQGVDGMLSRRKSKGDWCISYDESVSLPGRVNFTLAHEFGHYLLHRKSREIFQCTQLDIIDYDSPESRKQESEANQFASYLLMPIDDFRNQIKGRTVSLGLLGECAARYETSLTATVLKWLEFTEEAALMVVVDADDFVCWSYPSQSARKLGVYIASGTEVSAFVKEGLRLGISEKRDRVRRVPAGVWHVNLEAEESLIVSDRFELAMFLVRFPMSTICEHDEGKLEDVCETLARKVLGTPKNY